jgi:hypothetical protein
LGRYYDPTTGQFLNVDPLVDETGQPYAYTGDDPVNGTDPLGLASKCGCEKLAQSIESQTNLVKKRYYQMVEDKRGEFGENPPTSGTTASGHLNAYAQAQQGLQNLLDDWSGNGCGDGGTPAPVNAYDWAYQPAPRSLPTTALGPGAGGSAYSGNGPPSTEGFFQGAGSLHITPTEVGGGLLGLVLIGAIVILAPVGA